MATLTFSVGTETSDWRVDLQDLLENGTLSPTTVPSVLMTLTSGDYVLTLTGVGLTASDGDTLTAGTITGFTLTDDGTTVLTMTGLLSTDYADLQGAIDGAAGLDPTSADFRDLVEPFMAGEALSVTGSSGNDVIYGSAFADTINAGDGDDDISGGKGDDQIDGGIGTDTLNYSWDEADGATHGIVAAISEIFAEPQNDAYGHVFVNDHEVYDGFGDTDGVAGIENVEGTRFPDFSIASISDGEVFEGNGGFDTFIGGWWGLDTVVLEGDRDDYQVVQREGTEYVVLFDHDTGTKTFTSLTDFFQFADGTVGRDSLGNDIAYGAHYGTSVDAASWSWGLHQTGWTTYGWHYESGWEYGWFEHPWGYTAGYWGWEVGWFFHSGWELGTYEYGAWAWGWFYNYGGTGVGWNLGFSQGWGVGGSVYAPPPEVPTWYWGSSYDAGGWEYGTYQSGSWAWGWHIESGWDVGWYETASGWATGWYYHAGWELGLYGTGAWATGWHYDQGGWGIGNNLGGAGGWLGDEIPVAPPTTDVPTWSIGWSIDTGGWEVGWYQAGDLAWGWHYEAGWDLGWYMSDTGWAWGWYLHVGWEIGWFGWGVWSWGWHFDYGGSGVGWNLATATGGWLGSEGPFAF